MAAVVADRNFPVSFTAFAKPVTQNQSHEIDGTWRVRLQALMSVDEMVGTILDAITSLGIAKTTFFFYTSDNGAPASVAASPLSRNHTAVSQTRRRHTAARADPAL